jgi:hypothetical protein
LLLRSESNSFSLRRLLLESNWDSTEGNSIWQLLLELKLLKCLQMGKDSYEFCVMWLALFKLNKEFYECLDFLYFF